MEQNNFNRTWLVLLALVFAVGAAIFIYYNFFQKPQESLSFYDNLVASNNDFAGGESFYKVGDYTRAIAAYEDALDDAKTPDEQGQILYKIALAHISNYEPFKAIPIFKEVAAGLNYPLTTRAYAVQSMGQAFYSFSDLNVTAEIFKDEPYKSMYDAEKIPLSYRKLFEYASSFYPLGIPETRIAQWYAQSIVSGRSEKILFAKNIIRLKLENADNDVARTRGREEKGGNYIPEILTRKAYVLGLLSQAGDESLGNPEEAFAEALMVAQVVPAYEAQAKYFYALFLAEKYGSERSQAIQSVLSDFYQTTRYKDTAIVQFIKNEKNNTTMTRTKILLLAELDPQFKEFLKTLGWDI
ncbi:MAG: hypothetical protein WD897_00305 [Parcubacteria group bacterium]